MGGGGRDGRGRVNERERGGEEEGRNRLTEGKIDGERV